MKTIATKISTIEGLTFIERAARTVVGAALIGTVFVPAETTLGWLALLPLLGVYLLHSGVTGIAMRSLFVNTPAAYRLTYTAASMALIGSVFVIGAAPLGALVVLPLLGIYTGLGAVLGHSPLATAIDANKLVPYIVPPVTEASMAPSTETSRIATSRAA